MSGPPDAWDAAAALHDEAHPDAPFALCRKQTCADLKDALLPGWEGNRPSFMAGRRPETWPLPIYSQGHPLDSYEY